ncbi:hypothetical protein VT84_01170 [Gemmata sp. SH-PL17]|uniref:hypothetical protein n=1 Tax=Gemmata sp. SH-PL17 TaxID=1630693 RepID=UPI0004BACDBC|nr:hypothetical protein [Gemmata sp. SH-PL17]AMV22990.1 hypothetical protein VT84_01170 [Gemmata sp. SH-PL17]
MRSIVLFAASAALVLSGFAWALAAPKEDKKDAKETPAAEKTRTKSLKVKVSIDTKNGRLGDVLKEFAAQADMRSDMLVMWAYGTGFPYSQKVTYSCKDKPLEEALDELLTKAGGGLGYVIVSKEGDKHDGWVSLNTTGERGTAALTGAAADEAAAAERLALAKKLLDDKKPDDAKIVLTLITKKYANTKVAAEAKQLLMKLEK